MGPLYRKRWIKFIKLFILINFYEGRDPKTDAYLVLTVRLLTLARTLGFLRTLRTLRLLRFLVRTFVRTFLDRFLNTAHTFAERLQFT